MTIVLAYCYRGLDQPERAETLALQAVDQRRRTLGTNHPLTMSSVCVPAGQPSSREEPGVGGVRQSAPVDGPVPEGDTASALGASLTTAKHWCQYARAWLKVEMPRN